MPMPICKWIAYGCFLATVAELSSCCSDQVTCKGLKYLLSSCLQTRFADSAVNRHVLSQLLSVPVTYWLQRGPRKGSHLSPQYFEL